MPSFKFIPAVLIMCILFIAGTCKKKTEKKAMVLSQSLLGKTWLHSHEDDRGDTIVFRPNTYDFPPARGRTGFTLEANGVFRQYAIAPTDGLEEHSGKWEMASDKKMNVTFPDKKSTDFEAEIISVSPQMLKVKRTFKQEQ